MWFIEVRMFWWWFGIGVSQDEPGVTLFPTYEAAEAAAQLLHEYKWRIIKEEENFCINHSASANCDNCGYNCYSRL